MYKRKGEHLQTCLEKNVETGSTGFENYHFIHNALPKIDFKEIDTSISFLGKKLKAPILISSMTGGTKKAALINRRLARAAQKTGVALAVGSQRVAIENPKLAFSFQVRDVAPKILLLANLGAVQLNYGFGLKECRQAIKMIKADGLIFHLNPLQEVIQPEGNTNFKNLLVKISRITESLALPVIVKEVGAGLSGQTVQQLLKINIKIVDVAGWGGANWAKIEGFRAKNSLGEIFSQWGIPTTEAIRQCAKVKGLTIIASGGIRNGIEIAKALVLGADLTGMALPFLEPANKSSSAVEKKLKSLIHQLKITMFCLGVKNIKELKKVILNH